MIEAAEISSAAYFFIFHAMQELERIYRNYKIMIVQADENLVYRQ